MKLKMTTSSLVLLMVPLLTLCMAGCGKGHNDNVQSNGPDQLPLRLQLPKSTASESFRILQYQADNVTRRVEQSVLSKGPYSGGRQVRIFDSNNTLSEIRTFYPSMGDEERIAYRATFIAGRYDSENVYARDGVRQAEGHRLTDDTFERNTFYPGGKSVYRHDLFGRLMNDKKLEWKPFGHEVYRDDNTLAAAQQLMDDGGTVTKFYDNHNLLIEVLMVNKAGVAICETDYRPDGTTPLVRYDFGDTVVWAFDEKGQVSMKVKWYYDGSEQVTVFKAGSPVSIQNWEVDQAKSNKNATPPKIVLYLQWAHELRQDGSIVREVTFYPGTKIAQTIEVPEAPPADAKLKAPEGLPSLGSTVPAKSWMPPPPGVKGVPAKAATTPAATTPAVSPFWSPSGAKEVFKYSEKGFLLQVDSYKAGSSSIDKTETHKESAHIRAKFDKGLSAPLPEGMRVLDKAKDPTPPMTAPEVPWEGDID